MPTYLVERFFPDATAAEVRMAAIRARDEAIQVSEAGAPVRFVASTFSAEDETSLSIFEAPSREVVRELNARSGLPFERITEVVYVTAPELEGSPAD